MKPTELTISLLVAFVLILFLIMSIVKNTNNNSYDDNRHLDKQKPYNRDIALERLKQ